MSIKPPGEPTLVPLVTAGKPGVLTTPDEGKDERGCEGSSPGHCQVADLSITANSEPENRTVNTTTDSLATVIDRRTGRRKARVLDENVIRKRQIRNAERIVRRFAKRTPESLTAKEKAALDKSRQRLQTTNTGLGQKTPSDNETTQQPPLDQDAPSTSKRARFESSPTDSSPNKTRKKFKISRATVKGHQVAIADFGKPSRRLTEDEWQLLELRILDEVNTCIVESREPPLFGNLTTIHGFKVLNCENDATLEWLRIFAQSTSAPWQNADLRLIDVKDIKDLNRPLGTLVVKGPTIPFDRLRRYISSLNSDLLSKDWEVIRCEKTSEGTEVYLMEGKQYDVALVQEP